MNNFITILILLSVFTGCATHHENGVSVWQSRSDLDEVLETKHYEKYVMEDSKSVQSLNVISSAPRKVRSISTPVKIYDTSVKTYNDTIQLASSDTHDYLQSEVLPEQLVFEPLPSSFQDEIYMSSSASRVATNYSNDIVLNDNSSSHLTRVMTEDQLSSKLVLKLQKSLKSKGFLNSWPSGHLNSSTLNAIDSFQSARNLSRGGVTLETLNELEVYSY